MIQGATRIEFHAIVTNQVEIVTKTVEICILAIIQFLGHGAKIHRILDNRRVCWDEFDIDRLEKETIFVLSAAREREREGRGEREREREFMRERVQESSRERERERERDVRRGDRRQKTDDRHRNTKGEHTN
jgi:hypothetical protein